MADQLGRVDAVVAVHRVLGRPGRRSEDPRVIRDTVPVTVSVTFAAPPVVLHGPRYWKPRSTRSGAVDEAEGKTAIHLRRSAPSQETRVRSRSVFVSDLRHFLDLPADVPGPARRMADHLTRIARAATAGDPGIGWVSALPCARRPGRRPCPGHLALLRTEVPPAIDWRCTSCGDEGVIRGWERSPFDLRPHGNDPGPVAALRIVIPADLIATLRTTQLLKTAAERLVFRASASEEGAVLTGSQGAFDELLDGLAAETGNEDDRRRRRRIDEAVEVLANALRHAQRR